MLFYIDEVEKMAKKKELDCQKICLFCENASRLKDTEDVICRIKGVVSLDFSCRKFVYDPLKREPAQRPVLPEFDKEDLL